MPLKIFTARSTVGVDPFGSARTVSVHIRCPPSTKQVTFLLTERSLLLLTESGAKESSHSVLCLCRPDSMLWALSARAGFTSSAAALAVVWKAGANPGMWDRHNVCACAGGKAAEEPVRAEQPCRAVSAPAPGWRC